VTNGLMFWAVQFLDSGVGAVMNMSLIPLLLLVIGVVYGQERFTVRGLGGIGLGFVGLYLLFPPAGPRFANPMALAGAAAVVVGTVCYAWGAILSRPLLVGRPPMLVGGYVAVIGGAILLPLSLLVERKVEFSHFLELKVLGAWLFMVLGASVIAYTAFLALLRDWGPARAGLYCYISPTIAVIAGALLLGERVTPVDVAGVATLLLAAWLAGSGKRKTVQ
jgi:drug/metabolite transporter (DMT)-like permease